MRIIYSECVFVTLGIQHAMRMCPYSYPWPAQLYKIFVHYLIKDTIFGKKKVLEYKRRVFYFIHNFCLKQFLW